VDISSLSLHDALPIYGVVAADLLRDPDGEAIVVDPEGFVVPQQGAVEVLPVKENTDLHNAPILPWGARRAEFRGPQAGPRPAPRSEEHTSELQSPDHL